MTRQPQANDVRRRYDLLARAYNVVTLDRIVYGRARQRAIDLLHLREGDTVLDLGCGTGLSLNGLRRAVGATGTVIGVDLSAEMLKQAQHHIDTRGWTNVRVLQADASRLAALPVGTTPCAALFALSLSAMEVPEAALQSAVRTLPAGARVAVMDAGTPPTQVHRIPLNAALTPVWKAVFKLAAANPETHPWMFLDDLLETDPLELFHFGFVRVAAGVVIP